MTVSRKLKLLGFVLGAGATFAFVAFGAMISLALRWEEHLYRVHLLGVEMWRIAFVPEDVLYTSGTALFPPSGQDQDNANAAKKDSVLFSRRWKNALKRTSERLSSLEWNKTTLSGSLQIVQTGLDDLAMSRFADLLQSFETLSKEEKAKLSSFPTLLKASYFLPPTEENAHLKRLLFTLRQECGFLSTKLKILRDQIMEHPHLAARTALSSTALRRANFLYDVDTDKTQVRRSLFSLLLLTLLFFSSLFLTGVVLSFVFAFRMTAKLAAVNQAMKNAAHGDLTSTLSFSTKDEFQSLSHSFNTFTQNLKSRMHSMTHLLSSLNSHLSERIDLKTAHGIILDTAYSSFQAEGAALLIYDRENTQFLVVQTQGKIPPPYYISGEKFASYREAEEYFKTRSINPGETLLGEVAISKDHFLYVKDCRGNDSPLHRAPGDPLFISSLIVLALTSPAGIMGLLVLTKSDQKSMFSDLDFTNALAYSECAGIFLDNLIQYSELLDKSKIDRELEIIREIQKDLIIPREAISPSFLDLAFHFNPFPGMNGEYLDFFPLDKDRFLCLLCSVVGVETSLPIVMIMIKTVIRLVSHNLADPGEILTFLNAHLTRDTRTDNYTSLMLLMVDNTKQSITFANAGNRPLNIISGSRKQLKEFKVMGVPINLDASTHYKSHTFPLEEGDTVVLFSDAIVEAQNAQNEVFSPIRLMQNIAKRHGLRSREIVEAITKELEAFIDPQSPPTGDHALLVVTYKGGVPT